MALATLRSIKYIQVYILCSLVLSFGEDCVSNEELMTRNLEIFCLVCVYVCMYEACPESILTFWISRVPVTWPWCNLAASQRRPYCASVNSHCPVGLVSRQWDAVDCASVLCDGRINLLAPELFFLILAHPVKNVNNTGTKYVRIMKQTAFGRGKKRKVYTMFKIFSTCICWI